MALNWLRLSNKDFVAVSVSDGISNRLVTLERAFGRVFESAMDWAEEDFKKEIMAEKWPEGTAWPNPTKRQNGQTVGSPRDIVDLGGLLRSQKREDFGQETTVFTWTGEDRGGGEQAYALEVHDGYVSKGGNRMPARPFTDNAIMRLPDVVDQLLTMEARSNG